MHQENMTIVKNINIIESARMHKGVGEAVLKLLSMSSAGNRCVSMTQRPDMSFRP
jgi:hypothetical protein